MCISCYTWSQRSDIIMIHGDDFQMQSVIDEEVVGKKEKINIEVTQH